jgi:hypothetical protein
MSGKQNIFVSYRTFRSANRMTKPPKILICEKCDFSCGKKSDWERHILTSKHNLNHSTAIESKIRQTEFVCKKCNKSYTARNSLWYHEKKCNYTKLEITAENVVVEQTDNPDLYAIINVLIKENQEIRNLVITQHNTIVDQNKTLVDQNKTLTEIVKNQQPTTTTNNSHNTTIANSNNNYNINMFLTDKCKDAQNMSDFIEVLKNKIDMFMIEENGYVNGISKLFIQELNSMEITERPLHCTDERRNTFYVHNNDTWNKDENLKDTKKAINHVSHANLQQCLAWSGNVPKGGADREEHITRSIRLCKEANKSSDDDKVDKIIRNISKEIPLNKQVISDILIE